MYALKRFTLISIITLVLLVLNICGVCSASLILHYKFDETAGSTAYDSSDAEKDGTLTGTADWNSSGKIDGCLTFDDNLVVNPPTSTLNSISNQITVAMWLYGGDISTRVQWVFDAGNDPYVNAQVPNADDDVVFVAGTDSLTWFNSVSGNWYNSWNHYAFVKNASTGLMAIYLNGVNVEDTGSATASMSAVQGEIFDIGAKRSHGNDYIGSMDDFRVYDTALDANAIAALASVNDTTAPTPDPMTWATVPYAVSSSSISMIATTATDASGVEYSFDCTAGGGHDSDWQDSSTYTDTGLSASTQYTYKVQARDKSTNQNATAWSSTESATTDAAGGLSWDDLTWYYSHTEGNLFVNNDGDLEWEPEGGSEYITRIPDQDISDVDDEVVISYWWLSDGDNDCADCFDCELYCHDDDITCIAGTSDFRIGLFDADSEYIDDDGFDVTGNSIFTGYTGYNFRFGPNMIAGPNRWVDCTSEVHKTGMFAKKPQSSTSLMYLNEGLMDYIDGFELTPGDWSQLTVSLKRTAASTVRLQITLNDTTQTDYDTNSSEQPSNIDVFALHMRNSRPYSRVVLKKIVPDTNAPTPDPMTWSSEPDAITSSAITMTATTATDDSGVEYYFDCNSTGCHDSGWQDSATYMDIDLDPDTQYSYRVKARDKSANLNETEYSSQVSDTTFDAVQIDTTDITTTCSSVNYDLEGYYSADGSGLTGDLHTNYIGGAPPAAGEGTMWLSNGVANEWVKYEFDQTYYIDTMWVWNYNQDVDGQGDCRTTRGIKDCTIEYSVNGTSWDELGSGHTFAEADCSDTYAHNTEIDFNGVSAKYVRITVVNNHGTTVTGLSEVRFYSEP